MIDDRLAPTLQAFRLSAIALAVPARASLVTAVPAITAAIATWFLQRGASGSAVLTATVSFAIWLLAAGTSAALAITHHLLRRVTDGVALRSG